MNLVIKNGPPPPLASPLEPILMQSKFYFVTRRAVSYVPQQTEAIPLKQCNFDSVYDTTVRKVTYGRHYVAIIYTSQLGGYAFVINCKI